MEIPAALIYSLSVTAILLSFVVRHIYELCSSFLTSALFKNWLFPNLYPHIIRRGALNPPVSWANIITQILYWAGTIVFNVVGVTSLQDGSARAMSVTAFNFIPLLLSERLALAAEILDLSSRTVSQIHQSIGIMTVAQATLYLILQSMTEGFQLSQTKDLSGFLVAIALIVLLLQTMPIIRNNFYEIFLKTHLVLTVFAMYAIWQCIGNSIQLSNVFLIIGGGLYVCTYFFRRLRSLYNNYSRKVGWSRAVLTKYTEATKLSIKLPRPRRFRPGQYVYLWAPGVSFTSILQSHPYSVTWWEERADGMTDTISLLIKSQRGFSRDLQTLPSSQGPLLVSLDGPYGPILDTTSYATLVLLATGIGIATQISLVKAAMRDLQASRNALRRVSIIWQMDEESEEDWVREWIQEMLDKDDKKLLHCHQYVAGGFRDESSEYGKTRPYGKRVKKFYGRADVKEVLTRELECAVGRTLITVAANNKFRDEVREESTSFNFHDVEYRELEHQPDEPRNIWTFEKEQQDFKGVISPPPPERYSADHSISDHSISDHSISDHSISDHSISDHSNSDYSISDAKIG